MSSKSLWHLTGGCSVVLVFVVLSAVPGWCAGVNFTYSTFFPATHRNAVLASEWCKEIEKQTNGAVKIDMFVGGTLTPADQCYDGVVKGISDIGFSVLSYTKGRFPLMEVLDLALGSRSGYKYTKLCNAFYDKFHPKELDEVKVMYLHGHGPGILHTKNKAVHKLEDLKGLKIRCTGTTQRIVSHLGALPVGMTQTETYDALSKGVVDGLVSPLETLKGFKFAEVVKYTTEDYGASYGMCFFVVMNKKKWESLPKDVQATIEKINQEWIEKQGKAWDEIDIEGREYALSKGVQMIQLPKEEDERWAKAVQPLFGEYIKNMKAKGLPGEEAVAFCREWLSKNQ
ncbi:MAG: TRAP transporter substrate-binding protein [Desulfomonilaceae bacterium]